MKDKDKQQELIYFLEFIKILDKQVKFTDSLRRDLLPEDDAIKLSTLFDEIRGPLEILTKDNYDSRTVPYIISKIDFIADQLEDNATRLLEQNKNSIKPGEIEKFSEFLKDIKKTLDIEYPKTTKGAKKR